MKRRSNHKCWLADARDNPACVSSGQSGHTDVLVSWAHAAGGVQCMCAVYDACFVSGPLDEPPRSKHIPHFASLASLVHTAGSHLFEVDHTHSVTMMMGFAMLGSGLIVPDCWLPVFRSNAQQWPLLGIWSRSEARVTPLLPTIQEYAPWHPSPPPRPTRFSPECQGHWGDDGLDRILADPKIHAVVIALPAQAQIDVCIKMAQAWHCIHRTDCAQGPGCGQARAAGKAHRCHVAAGH